LYLFGGGAIFVPYAIGMGILGENITSDAFYKTFHEVLLDEAVGFALFVLKFY
jgi:hypothetical protein